MPHDKPLLAVQANKVTIIRFDILESTLERVGKQIRPLGSALNHKRQPPAHAILAMNEVDPRSPLPGTRPLLADTDEEVPLIITAQNRFSHSDVPGCIRMNRCAIPATTKL